MKAPQFVFRVQIQDFQAYTDGNVGWGAGGNALRGGQEAELGVQERGFVEVPSDCKSARLNPNGVSLDSRACPLLLR